MLRLQGEGFGPTAYLNGNDATGVAVAENQSALAPSNLLAPGPSTANSLVQVMISAFCRVMQENAVPSSQGVRIRWHACFFSSCTPTSEQTVHTLTMCLA